MISHPHVSHSDIESPLGVVSWLHGGGVANPIFFFFFK
jgi:hypothetical protein